MDFPTLTRLAYCQCRLRKVFGSVLKEYGWVNITLIRDRHELHGDVLGTTLDVGLQKGGYLPNVIAYYGKENPDFKRILRSASEKSRGKHCSVHLYVLMYVNIWGRQNI